MAMQQLPAPVQAPAPGPNRGPRRTPVLIAIGVLAVALAAAGGGALWLPRENPVDGANAAMRGAVGALIVLGIACGALALARGMGWLRGPWAQRSFLLAAVVVLATFGALAGAATAKDDPASRNGRQSPSSFPDNGPDVSFPDTGARVARVDVDGDGEPDRDADGSVVLVLDHDGDGVADARLVPCPSDPDSRLPDPGAGRVLIDRDCDGTIDGTIRLDSELLQLDRLPSDTDDPSDLDLSELDLDDLDDIDVEDPNIAGEDDDVATDDGSEDQDEDGDEGGSMTSILLTLLIVVALALLVWITVSVIGRWQRRREANDIEELLAPPEPEEPAIDTGAVDAAIENSIETLLGHPDPRVAIRAAYAVLLDALAASGFGRFSYEAPEEHLARCLGGLHIESRSMRELLLLFEVARFSTHPVGETERQRALDALRASQEQLREDALVPAGAGAAARWEPPEAR